LNFKTSVSNKGSWERALVTERVASGVSSGAWKSISDSHKNEKKLKI